MKIVSEQHDNIVAKPEAKLLIVDDNESLLDSLKIMLELESAYIIKTAMNVQVAERIMRDWQPDLALIDLKIGAGNGLELVKTFKQEDPLIKCLIMTAYRDISNVQEVVESGADDYLYKPLDPSDLIYNLRTQNERKEFEIQKTQLENQFKGVFEQSFQYMFLLDTEGKIIEINKTVISNSGLDKKDLIGLQLWELPCWVAPSEYETAALKQQLKVAVSESVERKPSRFECDFKGTNNDLITLDLSIKPILNGNNEVIFIIPEGRDITQQKIAERKLIDLAHHDSLTKLSNRKLFNLKIKEEISSASRHNREFAILYIDLDGFKKVNDSLGHDIGDDLLVEVAIRIKEIVREEDAVARLGGDEFGIILGEIDSMKSVSFVANRLIEILNKPFIIQEHQINISASTGIASYPDNGIEIDELIKNADIAMYNAKKLGKNNYQIFNKEMRIKSD